MYDKSGMSTFNGAEIFDFFFFFYKAVDLVGGGSVIIEAYPV